MIRILTVAVFAALCLASTAVGSDSADAPKGPSADEALQLLVDGNQRFVAGATEHPHLDAARIAETSAGQHPFVTIISCADSRVPPELLFDAGIGDLFVIRVAGNVSDTDEIGTAEYGTEHLGTPLVVVMGHTSCGAVKAVATGAQVGGSIPGLVDNIVPAVAHASQETGLEGEAVVPAAVHTNVWQSIGDLLSHSETIAELVETGKIKVVGAVYDISTGEVEWMGEHPHQAEFAALSHNHSH